MLDDDHWQSLVLAGGRGQRFLSSTPKPLHKVCGKTLLASVLGTVSSAGISSNTVVVSKSLQTLLNPSNKFAQVLQEVPNGTGGALQAGLKCLPKSGHLLVGCVDAVLVTKGTIERMLKEHSEKNAFVTVLSAVVKKPYGLGRVLRGVDEKITDIVEQYELETLEEKDSSEINTGWYCFDLKWLNEVASSIQPAVNGEYKITSLVGMAAKPKKVASVLCSEEEAYGANDMEELGYVEEIMRKRINRKHAKNGVRITSLSNTYIDQDVKIGRGTLIEPGASIRGVSSIGTDCVVGQNALILDSKLGTGVYFGGSKAERSYLKDGCKVGYGVDITRSEIGPNSTAKHFCYIGDAKVGSKVNIGAGSVFCNYNGKTKSKTLIGDGVFIGSGTYLIAPITVGDGVFIGAGSVVKHDLSEGKFFKLQMTPIVRDFKGI